jgi:hypothetical protein
MHILHPIAEAIQNQAANGGVIGVERVPGTGVVCVARAVLIENIISAVIDSAKPYSRAVLVPFGRVIEYDIEDHLNTGPVQRSHHVAKFVCGTERPLI